MALIKFGAGISEMRGKEGGVIYSRNAYGSYIKSKVSPVNPQTNKQQVQRGLMGNLAKAWATLSAPNRAAWENLGAQTTRVNRFGDTTNYTGFSLFMRLNRNLSICGEAAITTAPVAPTFADLNISVLTADESTPALSLTFTPTPLDADTYLALYFTNNVYGGRAFVKNYYRFVLASVSAASQTNIYTSWNAAFGNILVAGAHIFCKAKLIDKATGFDSVPVVINTVVVP